MTDTFTLTGRILDKSTAPVAGAKLVLFGTPKVARDPDTNEVYAPPPRITTDADGYLCVAAADGTPADTPGVELITGVQYRLRSANRALLDPLTFTAPDAGETLDLADIVSEPADLPETFADIMLDLLAALEEQGGADASETVKGIAELATQAETNTGTDDARIVTPLKLATRLAAYAQPLDSDLTAIAALATTSFGRAFLTLADASAGRTALALGTAATHAHTEYEAAGAAAAAQAASQPLDSDLTAIAALSTTSFGRSLLALVDAAAGRTALGLGTAATQNTTAFDAAGAASTAQTAAATYTDNAVSAEASARASAITTAINNLIASAPGTLDTLDELAAALGDDPNFATTLTTTLAGKQPLDSDLTAIAALTTTSYGRAFLALADAAAGRTALGLGTAAVAATGDFDAAGAAAAAQAASQPLDSDLTAIAALTTTSYGRAFLALADAAAGRTALGLGTAATTASTDYQPVDSDLTAIAALATTSYGRALLTLADQAALTAAVAAASTSASGIVELATSAETTTGTDTVRAVTPAGVKAVSDTLHPRRIFILAPLTASANSNFDTDVGLSTSFWLTVGLNSTGAVDAYREWDVSLDSGTYALDLLHRRGPDRGIYTVSIDGSSVGTIDGYVAAAANLRSTLTGITIATPGRHLLRLTMATKNASSTSYLAHISAINLTRTGA